MKIRTTFDEVCLFGKKSFKCSCGKRLVRSKKFYQTLNPYNVTADGNAKSAKTILEELRIEISDWKNKVDKCIHDVVEK